MTNRLLPYCVHIIIVTFVAHDSIGLCVNVTFLSLSDLSLPRVHNHTLGIRVNDIFLLSDVMPSYPCS